MRARDHRYDWDLLRTLTAKDLKLRYRDTTLGVAWSLASPIALALALHFALRLLAIDREHIALFLLAALFPWQWASNALSAAPQVFTGNAHLIRTLPISKPVLCHAVIVGEMIHFLFALPILVVLRILYGLPPLELAWLAIPLLVAVQMLFLFVCMIAIATANAFLRDIDHLVRTALLLLFYLTPIIYAGDQAPVWLVAANPVAALVVSWRALLQEGTLSPYLLVVLFHSAWLGGLAAWLYRRFRDRIAEVI